MTESGDLIIGRDIQITCLNARTKRLNKSTRYHFELALSSDEIVTIGVYNNVAEDDFAFVQMSIPFKRMQLGDKHLK